MSGDASPPSADAPDVPDAFLPWLEAWLAPDDDAGDREAALAAGVRALTAALRPEGRERGGAFDLLAADALVTLACERALAEEDPEGALKNVLERVARTRA